MDLNYTPEDIAFRKYVRAWLEANLPRAPLPTLDERRAWHRKLYEAGYLGMGWPKEYGGRARPMEQAIVADEMARANAPAPINGLGLGIVGPTIIVHGTEAQKQRYLQEDPDRRGDLVPALLRAQRRLRPRQRCKTRAEDRGDHYVVNGQKIWTSGGKIADWGLLLARTDPAVPKHQGISCFLIDMHQPGVDVRPLKQITGSSSSARSS